MLTTYKVGRWHVDETECEATARAPKTFPGVEIHSESATELRKLLMQIECFDACIESVDAADICEACGWVGKYEDFARDDDGVALCGSCHAS